MNIYAMSMEFRLTETLVWRDLYHCRQSKHHRYNEIQTGFEWTGRELARRPDRRSLWKCKWNGILRLAEMF